MDAAAISRLIRAFEPRFLLDPKAPGAEKSLASLAPGAIRGYIGAPEFDYRVGELDDTLVGLVAIRDRSHLYHLFVDQAYHGRGIGRALWEHARTRAIQRGGSGAFTVHSSLDAVPVYERFGFMAAGPVVKRDGVAYLPMELLPKTVRR